MFKAQIGQIIKSLDFWHTEDHYIIGEVIALNNDGTVTCNMIDRVWDNESESFPEGETITTPQNGNSFMDDEHPRLSQYF